VELVLSEPQPDTARTTAVRTPAAADTFVDMHDLLRVRTQPAVPTRHDISRYYVV